MTRWTATAFTGLLVLATSACGGSPDSSGSESTSAIDQAVKQAAGDGGGAQLTSTTGKATFTDGTGATGATVHLQVTAYEYPNGSFKGQQSYNSTGTPASWHGGTPVCYAVISTSPPTSVFAGPITSASDPSLVGQYYVIEVVDSTPEEIALEYLTKVPNCTNLKVSPLYTVTGGSLTVH
jgi:hypothetical protein